ncbi:MAG: C_GCAxxG_C_C family protein [Acidobacteria bacterium]|nr:C_GCAxxG_C_C family protein [Acidobacteriota bacterium]
MEVEKRAVELFEQGYNCAESVLIATCEATDTAQNGVPRIATALGGGIGRMGDVCGALSAAAIAIGLAHGRDSAKEARDPAYERAQRLYREFHRIMGATSCRNLTGFDISTAEGYQRFHDSGQRARVCNAAIALSAKLAEELSR